jgi:hypothetical protein
MNYDSYASMTDGVSVYKQRDGQWVLDEEATRESIAYIEKENAHRQQLAWALRSRPLTPEEMGEVASYGNLLLALLGSSYSEESLARLLNEYLLQQFRLQKEKANGKEESKETD